MKRSTRKNIIGITFGVLIVSGSIGSFAYANGANAAPPPSKTSEAKMDAAHADVQLTPEELAKHVSETFKVSEAEVKQAIDAKKDLADIGQAAMFAKISPVVSLAIKQINLHAKDALPQRTLCSTGPLAYSIGAKVTTLLFMVSKFSSFHGTASM